MSNTTPTHACPVTAANPWPIGPAFNARTHFLRFIDGGDGGTGNGGDGGAGNGGPGGQQGGQQGAGSGQQGGQQQEEELGEGGKKALIAERTTNRQLTADLAARDARIRELEDATKTDEQRRDGRLADLEKADREKDATIAQRDALIERYRIAAAKGLDLEAAERLRGTTKEEIEADADTWIKKWGSPRSPQEVPGAGHSGGGTGGDNVAPGTPRLRAAYESSSTK